MAKKKMHKKEEKAAKQHKTSSNTGMIVGIVVVAIIIILLVVLLRGPKEAAAPITTKPSETTEGKKTVELAPTPEFTSYCKSANGITALTLSYMTATCKATDGTVSFSMKNPTESTDVEGVYFEATSTSGRKSYVIDKNVVAAGATQTYTVSMTDLAAAIGETVTDFIVYPAQSGKACVNAAQIIIKAQSCQ